jgi:hypothetical protein
MKLLQTLISFRYCNKKISKKISRTFDQMMEGVGIIKLKTFCIIFFSTFSLMYVNS